MTLGGDRGEGRGAEARLRAELARVRTASPRAVLKLSQGAGSEGARAAFLAMVKQVHPHRFARESQEIQRLANELFLLVKAAYDELCAPPAPPRRRRRTTAPPAQPSRPSRGVRFKQTSSRPRDDATPIQPITAPRRARRPSNHSQLVETLETEEAERAERVSEARALLAGGRPAEAREIFRELAVNNPTKKQYRVYMHYAWGREHQAAGRLDEAAAELRRALKLDASFDEAVEALEEIDARPEKPGVLGRLFRRGR